MSSIAHNALQLFAAAGKAGAPVLEQLDPPRRAAVVMALVALTLIGLFLIIFVMVGGHWVRKLARHRPGNQKKHVDRSTANRQLRASLAAVLPKEKTDDTVVSGKSPSETKIDD